MTGRSAEMRGRPYGPEDWYLVFLCCALLAYALMGKGFAYLGFPPLYVGEIVLVFGAIIFFSTGCFLAVNATLPSFLLAFLIGFVVLRTAPDIGRYGFDALRDSVIVVYGAFAFVVSAILISRPKRLETLVRYYRTFCVIFAFAAPVIFFISTYASDYIPKLPNGFIPILKIDPTAVAAHLAGITIFALAGFFSAGHFWRLSIIIAIGMVATVSRGAMLSFVIPVAIATIACGHGRTLIRFLSVGIVVLFAAYHLEKQLDFDPQIQSHHGRIDPKHGRTPTVSQLAENVWSFFGETKQDLGGTSEWRLRWWSIILNDTFFGPHFWTGRGFGLNLAVADGFAGTGADPDKPLTRSPHNAHMTILARSGVPGLVLWLAVLVSWFLMLGSAIITARRRNEEVWARLFIFIACYGSAFLINAAFDVVLEGPMQGIWFWCIFGAGLGSVMIYRASPISERTNRWDRSALATTSNHPPERTIRAKTRNYDIDRR